LAYEVGGDIPAEHSVGTAGGGMTVSVVDPYQITGHDYEVFFDLQHYYRDGDGIWKETIYPDAVGKLAKTTDVTDTEITAAAVYSPVVGDVDVVFTMSYGSSDGCWIDGVEFEFPAGVSPKSAVITDGAYGNYPDYGQAALAVNGVINGNVVSWGDSIRSTIGVIEGNMYFSMSFASADIEGNLPMTISYSVWDDAYSGAIVDKIATITLTEIGYEFKTIKHWNVKDVDDAEVVLEDQHILNGVVVDHVDDAGVFVAGGEEVGADAGNIVDGMLLNLTVGYAAPLDFAGVDQTFADGSTRYRPMWHMNYFYDNDRITDIPYMIDSYMQHGWSGGEGTARSIDAYGFGTTSVDLLQRDYELRFTGEYDAAVGNYHPIKDGTGSLAIIYGARGYDLAIHPDPNNPGDGSAFFIRIPFEVWDMEAPGGPQQVSMLIYDRVGDPTAAEFYAFNPAGRMYCEFLVEPYADVIAGAAGDYLESSNLTWNTIWWNCQWTTGDVLHFIYDNPIQQGSDLFTFSTESNVIANIDIAKDAVEDIRVFPNPYYAYNSESANRFDDFVTFSHLPAKVTIRLFNLAGLEVRKLEKESTEQFLVWDLRNESDMPVASGAYIAHIDMPDLDKVKILKLFIIQDKQIMEFY